MWVQSTISKLQISKVTIWSLVVGFCLMFGFWGLNYSKVLAAFPATSTYQLNSYGFGSGGGANSTTSTYALEGIGGEVAGQTATTSNFSLKPGFIETQQAYVPKVTLSNPASYYDKLKFVIDQQANPSDAKYALQISTTSDFSSNINYIKSDLTIGPVLTLGDYQTYSIWGGAGGNNLIGLAASTTYYLRAKAIQHLTTQNNGKYTETGYGPSSSAATLGTGLSFCIYTNANCGAGGNTEAFGTILPATVNSSPTNIGVDFATNADFGGSVYIYSANAGLKSTRVTYTITSATADLSSAAEGFGARVSGTPSVGSGGPLNKVTPYDGSPNNVGQVGTTINAILKSAAPLTAGNGAIQLQVRPSNTTPAATDYSETLTLIAAATF